MLTRTLVSAAFLFLTLAPQVPAPPARPEPPKLADLIPADRWKATGIAKLTDAERSALRDEIISLLQCYRASLTDGVAVIAPSVSTSMKARELRAQLGKREVPPRYAEAILVVVRSALVNPLFSLLMSPSVS